MKLPEISIEQNNIIKELLLNNNVVVDSVAGSGKTTCNLHIAKYFHNINILLLTYNSKLKLETREKAKKLGLHNLEVHSYHSFCVKYYDNQSYNDTIINKIIKTKKKPLKQFNFDLIVPDEAQDITSLYYELICKIYKDNNNTNTKMCIFGDKKQSIFDFNKADQRFIEYASKLFNFNSYNWVKCNLSVSFRITFEMSLFINKCLLKEERIISNKITNNKPRYIICDCFGDKLGTSSRTFEEVKYYFNLGYKPSDIFILAPSIKSVKSPVRQLENKIKREMPDVMVYVPTNDDEKLDEELLEGKIIFSTFHQTKGLERKVVIIFNFDNSYFEFYKKDANPCICSNELYVATTRGIEYLTLFHHSNNEYLHFIDKTIIHEYCYFEDKDIYIEYREKQTKNIPTSITDIIKFIPQNIIDECFNQLEIIKNDTYSISKINIPLKISNEETTESVSEITGLAIPSMFELKLKNKMNIFEILVERDFEENIINNGNNGCLIQLHNKPKNKKHNINNINILTLTPEELLYISNCWNTLKNGYLFKIYQITNYDPAYTWTVTSTVGSASINSSGLVSVASVGARQAATLNVTTSRSGYSPASASVTSVGPWNLSDEIQTQNITATLSGTTLTVNVPDARGWNWSFIWDGAVQRTNISSFPYTFTGFSSNKNIQLGAVDNLQNYGYSRVFLPTLD